MRAQPRLDIVKLSPLTTRIKALDGPTVFANCEEVGLMVLRSLLQDGEREGEWLVTWCTREAWEGRRL